MLTDMLIDYDDDFESIFLSNFIDDLISDRWDGLGSGLSCFDGQLQRYNMIFRIMYIYHISLDIYSL